MGLTLMRRVREIAGDIPFVAFVNKEDLEASWEVHPEDLRPIEERAYAVVHGSAYTGAGVHEAFDYLADAILDRYEPRVGVAWT